MLPKSEAPLGVILERPAGSIIKAMVTKAGQRMTLKRDWSKFTVALIVIKIVIMN